MAPGRSSEGSPTDALGAGPPDIHPFGNDTRRDILDLLSSGEKTIAEIAGALAMHPATLRYHLGLLLRQRLVEEVRPQAGHGRGRPAIRYRAARHIAVPGYPPRKYELLAVAALQSLIASVGEERAREELVRHGVRTGETLIAGLAERVGGMTWGPEAFERILVGDMFHEFGITAQVLERKPGEIRYRFFTCPFLELAEQAPKLVCDALDVGVHRGLDKGLGAVTDRLKCMGHGDPHCEYRTRWSKGRRARRETDDGSE